MRKAAVGRQLSYGASIHSWEYIVKQSPGQFEVGGSVVFPSPEGIAVRKNEASLFSAIQRAYQQVKTAGTYRQLLLKWGLTNEELTAVDRRLKESYIISNPFK